MEVTEIQSIFLRVNFLVIFILMAWMEGGGGVEETVCSKSVLNIFVFNGGGGGSSQKPREFFSESIFS